MIGFENLKLIKFEDLEGFVGHHIFAGSERFDRCYLGKLMKGEFNIELYKDVEGTVKGHEYGIKLLDNVGFFAGLADEEKYNSLPYRAYALDYATRETNFESLVGKTVYAEYDNEINLGIFVKVKNETIIDCDGDELLVESPYAVLYLKPDEYGCTYLSIEHNEDEVSVFKSRY